MLQDLVNVFVLDKRSSNTDSVLLIPHQQRDGRLGVEALRGHKTLALAMTGKLKCFLDHLHLILTVNQVGRFFKSTIKEQAGGEKTYNFKIKCLAVLRQKVQVCHKKHTSCQM